MEKSGVEGSIVELEGLTDALTDESIHYVMVTTVHEWTDSMRAVGITPRSAQAMRDNGVEDIALDGTRHPAFVVVQQCGDFGPEKPKVVIRKLVIHDSAFDFIHATLVGIERLAKNMAAHIDWTKIDPEDDEACRVLLEKLTLKGATNVAG